MTRLAQLLTFVLLVSIRESQGYSGGAPDDRACGTMAPGHGGTPQNTESPYFVNLNQVGVKGGEKVRVTLSSANDATEFKGFLALAQKLDAGKLKSDALGAPAGKIQKPVGADAENVKHVKCGNNTEGALTHSDPSGKKTMVFDWIAPNDEGDYVILVTFVKDYSTYWVQVRSTPVKVTKNSNYKEVTTQAPKIEKKELSKEAQELLGSYYEGCGKTKGCFGLTTGCIENRDCELFTTFSKDGTRHTFQVSGKVPGFDSNRGYAAVGLSFDKIMGSDSVIACYKNGNEVQIFSYFSAADGIGGLNESPTDGLDAGYPHKTREIDGRIFCEFSRTPLLTTNGVNFNLASDFYHIALTQGAGHQDGTENLDLASQYIISTDKVKLSDTRVVDEGVKQLATEVYNGCGETKGCFGLPFRCISSQSCQIFTSFDKDFNFQLMGTSLDPAGYIAVGLSFDPRMGQDSVIGCTVQDGTPLTKSYYNIPNAQYNSNMNDNENGLEEIKNGSYIDGTLLCEFKRTPILQSPVELKTDFNLVEDNYHLLLAKGSSWTAAGLSQHDILHGISPYPINLNNYTTFEPADQATQTPIDEIEELKNRFYSGCSENKGCLGHPMGCIETQNCEMFVAFDANRVFQVTGTLPGDGSTGHVSVGISHDIFMGDDSVSACVLSRGEVRPYAYYNTNQKDNKVMSNNSAGFEGPVEGLKGRYLDGVIFCEFTRTPKLDIPELNNKVFDLEKDDYYFMLARGKTGSNLFLAKHDDGDKIVSASAHPLSYIGIVGGKSNILIQLHAGIMIIAWLLCASTGMFTARYYKQTHTDFNPLNKAFWFLLHITCMFSAAFLTVCGIILILIEIRDLSKGLDGAGYYHPILGFVLLGLAVVQVLIAFFRPHPGTARRPIFNWIHWTIGNSAHIVGIACIFLAKELSKSGLKEEGSYLWVVTGFVVFHVVMHVIMSIHTIWADKQMDIQVKMRAARPGPMKPSGKSDEAPGTGFRTAMLTLYLVGCAAVAIYLIVKIVIGL